MSDLLIRNATIVNEDQIYNADVKISNGIIEQIGTKHKGEKFLVTQSDSTSST